MTSFETLQPSQSVASLALPESQGVFIFPKISVPLHVIMHCTSQFIIHLGLDWSIHMDIESWAWCMTRETMICLRNWGKILILNDLNFHLKWTLSWVIEDYFTYFKAIWLYDVSFPIVNAIKFKYIQIIFSENIASELRWATSVKHIPDFNI